MTMEQKRMQTWKHRTHGARLVRLLMMAVVAVAVAATGLIVNYGARQEYAEYRLMSIAVERLSVDGALDSEDLATIMGIAHKESRFWNGAIGRHHEAGVMQISERLAQDHDLRISMSARKSSSVQKLLFLDASPADVGEDQRLDERLSMRVAIDHFLRLKEGFRTRDGLDAATARDLAILAFHLGEARTKAMLARSERKTLGALLDALADPTLPRETWFERAIAVSFAEHVLRYRESYLKQLPEVMSRTAPDASDLLSNIAATPKEFHTRIFGDMPELERAMRERSKGA
jgi:hypothetical protein